MSNHRYKIEFEVVSAIRHPEHYRGDGHPAISPDKVPEEHWSKVSREAENLSQLADQYARLKMWETTGTELVRNPKLYEMTLPHWQKIDEIVL